MDRYGSRISTARRAALGSAFASLVLGTLPAGAQAAEAGNGLPARLALIYSLLRSGLEIARIEETFERSGNGYRLLSEARAVGLAALLARGQGWRRESRGTVAATGLRPDQFTDQRGANPLQRARFDWATNQIRFDRPGTDTTEVDGEALPPGTTDRLSFPYALAQRAMQPPGLPAGEWEAPMTDGRRVTRYRFTVSGRETVATPAGAFETIRVSRVREKDDNATEVWLAAARGMIPVRILVTEPDGATFDQVLAQIGGQ
ncbi:MAG: DUF3108 domain-containing protein [Rhodocyclaceae bacterium]|nr:DUF3108 domain-containing protein [Rhodocyclaceae bacterium]MCA3073445.1 DUF3108 domain-containing protein [Rhodocyclaceae bacterium]MCA3089516.1 DUF3108 domain-containing protein [Rhodocyclaceae bacterium]MCA3093077.1 DUF3108 domain-containing protein [Rhodocyclaceae bacterium]MCA3096832.1 DUF3108 domain-containing protein [Rhodocyclaceae bacterium]